MLYVSIPDAPFSIGKPQLRPPRCDTRVTPEEKRRFLAQRAQETEQRRALQCRNRRRNDLSPVSKLFHEQFPLWRGVEVLRFLPSTHYSLYDFDLRATHARTLLPEALASVSFGFVLVRVRSVNVKCEVLLCRRLTLTSEH